MGTEKIKIPTGLVDTGATFCTMKYDIWRDMGMNQLLFDSDPNRFQALGYTRTNVINLPFKDLRLRTKENMKVGNGESILAYEARLCELNLLGEATSEKISLRNITVHLLNDCTEDFILGMNVLRYLDLLYLAKNQTYRLSLGNDGEKLLEEERKYSDSFFNNLSSTF